MTRQISPTVIALALGNLFSPAGAAEPALVTESIEIVGNTPMAGVGVARSHLPSNVQSIDEQQLEEAESLNMAEHMARRIGGVTVNEVQGNPYQADLNFRGFTASPLLGMAQGLSVYVDGVRANEPFGDTVNWDLIPNTAIAAVDLLPGSNPLFGLNTLGGALAMRTKNGFSHPGGKLEYSAGSFARQKREFEYGANDGRLGAYVAGDWFSEDGWRDYSPSSVKQLFGKLSFRDALTEADLSVSGVRSSLVGNGVVPQSLLAERRENIFTHPDRTQNSSQQIAFNGRRWLSDESSVSATLYRRHTLTRTLNGDMNDEFEDDPTEESGALNRTRTRQTSTGGGLQWNLATARHTLAIGASYDQARVHFRQTQQQGDIDSTRGIANLQAENEENRLRGSTRTASLYVSDTVTLQPDLHLTASARYNRSHVQTVDELNPVAPNLDGDHRYQKLNPALGLAWQIHPRLNAYAGFSQGTRIPTPIELGCADPANPCTLPNSMAADPYLKQVVSRTLEAGLRGDLGASLQWQAGVYRTLNTDDILFVGTSTSAGYFTNYGKTQRQGLELGLRGSAGRVNWHVDYSWLQASFRSSACLLGANNSTRGSSAECTAGGQDDEILVRAGNRIPGLPAHSLKLGLAWRANDWLKLGANVQAFSSQYARGNENNQHVAGTVTDLGGTTRTFTGSGKVAGYAILNLNAEAALGSGWQLFAKLNNVFDTRYASAAVLAENPFIGAGHAFDTDPDRWQRETFVAPGAPRAAWLGVRYLFGGK